MTPWTQNDPRGRDGFPPRCTECNELPKPGDRECSRCNSCEGISMIPAGLGEPDQEPDPSPRERDLARAARVTDDLDQLSLVAYRDPDALMLCLQVREDLRIQRARQLAKDRVPRYP